MVLNKQISITLDFQDHTKHFQEPDSKESQEKHVDKNYMCLGKMRRMWRHAGMIASLKQKNLILYIRYSQVSSFKAGNHECTSTFSLSFQDMHNFRHVVSCDYLCPLGGDVKSSLYNRHSLYPRLILCLDAAESIFETLPKGRRNDSKKSLK